MRNDIYRARAREARAVVRVRSHESMLIVILLWGGSTHPAGVPMDDAIPLAEILRTWPIIRYVYERARGNERR